MCFSDLATLCDQCIGASDGPATDRERIVEFTDFGHDTGLRCFDSSITQGRCLLLSSTPEKWWSFQQGGNSTPILCHGHGCHRWSTACLDVGSNLSGESRPPHGCPARGARCPEGGSLGMNSSMSAITYQNIQASRWCDIFLRLGRSGRGGS